MNNKYINVNIYIYTVVLKYPLKEILLVHHFKVSAQNTRNYLLMSGEAFPCNTMGVSRPFVLQRAPVLGFSMIMIMIFEYLNRVNCRGVVVKHADSQHRGCQFNSSKCNL